MKAITFDSFGPSSVLKISEITKPQASRGEILIRLSHTSVNPVDWKIRLGYLKDMLPHAFPIVPGWDASGEVVALGEGVTNFAVGDAVYAYTRLPVVQHGTYAEFIALPAEYVTKKPEKLRPAEAAAVPLVGLTAYQALKKVALLQPGEQVLILGASGGVGSFAVQFAKILGADVTAVSSKKNLDYVKGLGADQVIDYTEQDFVTSARAIAPEGFDVIFDAVGGDSLKKAGTLIKKGSKQNPPRIVSIVDTPEAGLYHFVYPSGSDLTEISQLFNTNRLKMPAIEERSILEAAAMQDKNAEHHTRGKIVLVIDFNSAAV